MNLAFRLYCACLLFSTGFSFLTWSLHPSQVSVFIFFSFSFYKLYLFQEGLYSDLTDMRSFPSLLCWARSTIYFMFVFFAFNSLQPMQACLIWQLLSEVYLAESNFEKSAQTPDSWELHVVESYLVIEGVEQWGLCKLKRKNQVYDIWTFEKSVQKLCHHCRNKETIFFLNAYISCFIFWWVIFFFMAIIDVNFNWFYSYRNSRSKGILRRVTVWFPSVSVSLKTDT